MADTHCFVCHIQIPAPVASSRVVKLEQEQLTTKHTQRCVYTLLEQFLGYSVQEERSAASRWCTGCMDVVNDYDLAVQTANRRESELIELFMNAVKLESDSSGEPEFIVADDTQSIATNACEVEHLDEDVDELLEYRAACKAADVAVGATATTTRTGVSYERLDSETEAAEDASNVILTNTEHTRNADQEDDHTDDVDDGQQFDEVYLSEVENENEDEHNDEDEHSELYRGSTPNRDRPGDRSADANEALFKCTRCVQFFESNSAYKVHITACKSTRKDLACPICEHISRTQSELQIHIALHNGINPFECDVCGRQFPFRGALVRHMTVHTREKPYQCDKCGKQFIHYSSFHMHQLAHDDVRDKQCTVCGMELRSNSHLTRHMRVHSGEKPYSCPTCGQKFAQRYNMMTHFKTHQGIHRANTSRTHKCQLCQTVFEKASMLKRHRAEKHGGAAAAVPDALASAAANATIESSAEQLEMVIESDEHYQLVLMD